MKKVIILCLLLTVIFPVYAAGQDITLPEVTAEAGMDVLKAMELRAVSRSYEKKKVPMDVIATILWAGNGIILEKGDVTIHGYDAVTSATRANRNTTPWGWGSPYMNIYLLLEDGAYLYLPQGHKLRLITKNDLRSASGSEVSNAFGVIVVATDYDKMPGVFKEAAFLSAGSVLQNMYVAAAAYNVQTLTQVSLGKKELVKGLSLTENIEPLAIMPFGYTE